MQNIVLKLLNVLMNCSIALNQLTFGDVLPLYVQCSVCAPLSLVMYWLFLTAPAFVSTVCNLYVPYASAVLVFVAHFSDMHSLAWITYEIFSF